MIGRRVYPDADSHLRLAPGDYGQDADGTWRARAPRLSSGDLSAHDVTEHEDGTITVSPVHPDRPRDGGNLARVPDPRRMEGGPMNNQRGMIPLSLLPYLVAALVVAGLVAWALFERSRYLDCKSTTVALTAQVDVLGDKIQTQNRAVEESAKAGAETLKRAAALLAEARKQSERNAPTLARLEAAIQAPAQKRPDGTAKNCGDARREIREARTGEHKGGAK